MATFKEHLQKHSKRVVYHVKKHHKKYLFGVVGGAIAVKFAFTFIASIGLYEGYGTFAQEFTGEVTTGEVTTGEVTTGEVTTGEVTTGEVTTGEVMTGEVTTGEVTTGEVTTGELTTGEVTTGEVTTGELTTGEVTTGELTTGELTTGEVTTGELTTGEVTTGELTTGEVTTGGFTQEIQTQTTICNNSDFNFINPLSGSNLKGNINFSWTYIGNDCSGKNFNIYLRDHNNQWIEIGTSSYLNTWYQFNSSQLYSGFYNILSNSGNIIYTGQYSGINSQFYTGYKIKFVDQNDDIVYNGDIFSIDNQLPEITGLVMEFTGNYNSGYIGLSGIINLNFIATENLTGIVVNILGINATLINQSGLNYKYLLVLSNQNSGDITYANILFEDLAGNTGSKYLTSQVLFDKLSPILNSLLFTGTYTGFDVIRNTNEATKYEFRYVLSGSQTGAIFNSASYLHTGSINITGLSSTASYNFTLKLIDSVNNMLTLGGNFYFSGDRIIFTYQTISSGSNSGSNLIVNVSTGSTGTISTISNVIRQEVNKFKECKSEIETTNISIKINNQDIQLNMPNFSKSDIRKIVNAFTIVVMDKLERSDLTKDDLDSIANSFDDFLIVLKLVRDDDNQCKQNLSNYHIRAFQKTLNEYKISLE